MWRATPRPYARLRMASRESWGRNGLTAVGTFSGAGGSCLGLEAAGWRVPVAVEFIRAAAETYRVNFPDANLIERDIRRVTVGEIRDFLRHHRGSERVDLLEGSPPCASFSQQGARERGWHDVRAYSDGEQRTDDLFDEFVRLLRGLEPRAFIAENVPGMLMGRALEEYAHVVTLALQECGYRVAARVMNAANFGVPQDRRRLIFLGYRQDTGLHPRFPPPVTPEPHTLRQALASVQIDDPDHVGFLKASSMAGTAVGRTWEAYRGLRDKEDCARCGEPMRAHRSAGVQELRTIPKRKADEPRCARCGQLMSVHPGERAVCADGEFAVEVMPRTRARALFVCADGERAVEVKNYALMTVPELDAPCPTLTATGSAVTSASVVHPLECRKFTPAECKAICGFPEDFVLTGSREQRYERMGRAVPPPLYVVMGRAIAEALGHETV